MCRPKVTIILVNYKRTDDTLACLESLRSLPEQPEIVVVDNASGPAAVRVLQEQGGITLLPLEENLGFAGGNNVGIKHAITRDADFIWLLNNDTVVQNDTLTWMLNTAEADPRIGMVGSKIYYYHDPKRLWYAGATVNRIGKASHRGLGEVDTGQYDDPPQDVGYVTGCSMLVRREVIEQVGLLAEDYFMYYEDTDWSLRAQRGGWRTVIEPRSMLWHKEGASSGAKWHDPSPAQDYYDLRNGWFFVDRHRRGIWNVLGKTYLFVRFLRKLVRMVVRRETNRGTKVNAQLRALYHAWIGLTGPMLPQRPTRRT